MNKQAGQTRREKSPGLTGVHLADGLVGLAEGLVSFGDFDRATGDANTAEQFVEFRLRLFVLGGCRYHPRVCVGRGSEGPALPAASGLHELLQQPSPFVSEVDLVEAAQQFQRLFGTRFPVAVLQDVLEVRLVRKRLLVDSGHVPQVVPERLGRVDQRVREERTGKTDHSRVVHNSSLERYVDLKIIKQIF